MEDSYNSFTYQHWIATPVRRSAYAPAPAARNDGGGANNRHCEGALRPRQSSATGYRRKQGFSLIELLISLIIISIILNSLAPIITKKYINNHLSISTKQISCKEGYYSDNGKCLRIPCPNDTIYIPTVNEDKGICMMKYNAEPAHQNLPNALSAGIKALHINTNTNGASYTCWGGSSTLGATGIDNSSNPKYSGKYRMVCTYLAAKKICENYKTNGKSWRLPDNAEWLYIINNYSNFKEELGFCSAALNTEQNIAQCTTPVNETNRGCPGPNYYYCYPYLIFSGTEATNGYSYRVHDDKGTLKIRDTAMHPLWTSSVRCVLDN